MASENLDELEDTDWPSVVMARSSSPEARVRLPFNRGAASARELRLRRDMVKMA